MVLARTYSERLLPQKTWLCSAAEIRNPITVGFVRYKPSLPKTFVNIKTEGGSHTCFNNEIGNVRAFKLLPGKYRYDWAVEDNNIITFDNESQQFVFEVKPGEAVYIGDIVMVKTVDGNRFRMASRKHSEEARKIFEQRFAESGLKFIERLARNASFVVPKLPK